MKEFSRTTVVEVDVIDPTTGEKFTAKGSNIETSKYYSVKNITSRINAMTLFSMMEKVCKSSKDISITNMLTEMVTQENEIRVDNISKLAKEFRIARSKLNAILKSYQDNDFLLKLDRGVYMVNPYVFVGRRVRSNLLRETAQIRWNDIKAKIKQKEHNETN